MTSKSKTMITLRQHNPSTGNIARNDDVWLNQATGACFRRHATGWTEMVTPIDDDTPPQPSKGKYLTGQHGELDPNEYGACGASITTIAQAQLLAKERNNNLVYERDGVIYGGCIKVHKIVSENVAGTGWCAVE